MNDVQWDIRREGHAWKGDEAMARYYLAPEKIELIRGKLFWNDEQRQRMLGLLLEQLGAGAAGQSAGVARRGGRAIRTLEVAR